MAADNAFAAMLLDLWERVTRAGGAVGFSPSAHRADIAGQVAETIQAVKGGRRRAVALTAGRSLIGFAALEPGRGQASHLGSIDVVLVDPVAQGRGSGTRLIGELVDIAAESGIVRLELVIPADDRLTKFFAGAGFREWARRPAGRLLDGTLQDDLLWCRLLVEPVPKGR